MMNKTTLLILLSLVLLTPSARAQLAFTQMLDTANPFNGIDVGSDSTPTFVDIDKDGDFDAFIGESNGAIKYYENLGTDTNPDFVERIGIANPLKAVKEVFSAPAFIDIDNDGDFDAFIGTIDGFLKYYENLGTARRPRFITSTANPANDVKVKIASTPSFVDIDQDGDFDLFIGQSGGTVNYYENTGNADSPSFEAQTGTLNPLDENVGIPISSEFTDMFTEELLGGVSTVDANSNALFEMIDEELGTDFSSVNCPSSSATPDFSEILNDELYGTGTPATDLDSAFETLADNFGIDFGIINCPNPLTADITRIFTSVNEGFFTIATFVDIDHDSDFDAFIGVRGAGVALLQSNTGSIHFYENTGTTNNPNFVEKPFVNPFRGLGTNGGGADSSIAFVDIDNDGDFDAFTGQGDGTLKYYQNTGTVSNATPQGGRYNRERPVTLSCIDCDKIYYTLDGTTPTTAATEYVAPIQIAADTTLKFITIDAHGNILSNKTENYRIDTAGPEITLTAPENEATLERIAVIKGEATDPEGGLGLDALEIQVTNGTSYLTETGSFTTTSQPWLTPTGLEHWFYDTSTVPSFPPGIYTITARAYDKANNLSEDTIQLKINRAFTRLSLELPPTILQNVTLNISGELTRYPEDSTANLSNLPITLTITAPNGSQRKLNTNTTQSGQYQFDLISGLTHKGQYTFKAYFEGTELLAEADSHEKTVLVNEFAGYAILVQGRNSTEQLKEAYNKNLNRVYQTLIKRGFREDNIRYFNYNTKQEQVYNIPKKSAIQESIESWAKERLNGSPAPFYLIMVDHGNSEYFYLHPESITAEELNTWLSVLESGLSSEALEEPRIFILGTCYSGSFIPKLSKLGRVIITSAKADELSHTGPKEFDDIPDGEYFIKLLFEQLGQGKNFQTAFETAIQQTELYTARYGGQHPLLDDNGDGRGSPKLSVGGDGQRVRERNLGVDTSSAPIDIIAVTETLYLNQAESSALLWLMTNYNDPDIIKARIQIHSPKPVETAPTQSSETAQVELDLPTLDLSFNSEKSHFETTYEAFNEPGQYQVFYYAGDLSGNISPVYRSVVYKNKPGNQPPESFSLLSPEKNATPQTTLIFDWESSLDPDGDSVTYNLIIGTDSQLQTIVYREEELTYSMTSIDSQAKVIEQNGLLQNGLENKTTYYWRVEAVDSFGAKTASEIRSFKTNETSAPPGIFRMEVNSLLDDSPVENVTIAANVAGEVETVAEQGYYLLTLPEFEGEMQVSAPGFQQTSFPTTSRGEHTTEYQVVLQPITTFSLTDRILSLPVVNAGQLGRFTAKLQAGESLEILTLVGNPTPIQQRMENEATFSLEPGVLSIPIVELIGMPTRYQVELQLVPESNLKQFRLTQAKPLP